MAPSQLSQLKSALSSSGLSSSSSKKSSKSKGKAGLTPKDREKKQQRLEDIKKTLNKFDVREGKVKFDVGGKGNTKLAKGVSGRPSESRSKGIEARKASLLPEHQLRRTGHTGSFLDRRFGASDPTITPEAAALARFTRARESSSKKSRFNLQDEDEEGLGFGGDDGDMHLGKLTHGGRGIDELRGDDFLMQGLDDDDIEDDFGQSSTRRQTDLDGEGMIAAAAAARRPRFGENVDEEDGEERKKTKAEVMAEVILKSKTHKYERQQQKELDEDLRHQLDLDLTDLRSLLAPTTRNPETGFLTSTTTAFDPNKTGTNDMPLGKPSRMAPHVPGQEGEKGEAAKTADDMDYDQYVRSLAFDRRAKPKDRIKSEEEVAKEESERLVLLEKNRLRRMRGLSPEEEGEATGRKRRRAGEEVEDRKKKKSGRVAEADDLSDDFVMSGDEEDEGEEYGLGKGLGVAGESGSEDEEEEEEEEEDEEEEDEDMEGSEEEDEEEEDDQDLLGDTADLDDSVPGMAEDNDDTTAQPLIAPTSRKSEAKSAAKEIPYTFKCPTNHDDLLDIMDGLAEKDVEVVVKRIRALYHPSLGEGNKSLLEGLLGVLLDHVLYLASASSSGFSTISLLTPHIIALVALNPIPAAHHFTSKLSLMQKNLLRGLARGPLSLESRTFPGSPELALLRLVGITWSTSDFSNPVGAPSELLMGQYLAQGVVRRLEDVGSGLFLCSLFLQYESFSKRLVPEAINFLSSTLLVLSPKSIKQNPIPGSFPTASTIGRLPELRLRPKAASQLDVKPADLVALLTLGDASAEELEQAKVDLLSLTMRLVGRYAGLYVGLGAFLEVFGPLRELMGRLSDVSLPLSLRAVLDEELTKLINLLTQSSRDRRPLQMQDHKPVAIKTYTPKFEANFSAGKHYDPDAERNAASKLKALYKKEKKGAIRELRKDNKFLAGERAKEQKAKDEDYTKRMRRVEGDIATNERAEEKAMEREKNRDKRRAGGKK